MEKNIYENYVRVSKNVKAEFKHVMALNHFGHPFSFSFDTQKDAERFVNECAGKTAKTEQRYFCGGITILKWEVIK